MTRNPNLKLCGAATQRGKGPPCRAIAMANGRCRLHGGASPSGAKSPAFKHGRYSKDMPEQILARYEAALTDQTLLDLSAEIALVDARLSQLTERLQEPEIFGVLARIQSTLPALSSDDPDERAKAQRKLTAILDSSRDDSRQWREIFNIIERRRKLVESERRRRIETQTTMTVEELVNVATALANIALRYIPAGEARDSYLADVQRTFTLQRTGSVPAHLHSGAGAGDAGGAG